MTGWFDRVTQSIRIDPVEIGRVWVTPSIGISTGINTQNYNHVRIDMSGICDEDLVNECIKRGFCFEKPE